MKTKITITALTMKRALNFAVTVNSLSQPNQDNVVAAFAHPSDAQEFATQRRLGRPDLIYRLITL